MKVVSITVGIGLILLSLTACTVFLVGIADPAGTKMADDGDPFGEPPGRVDSVAGLLVSAAIGATGVYLISGPFHSRRKATKVLPLIL